MNKTILILTCWLLGFAPGTAQQRKMDDVQHIADSVLNRPTRWGKRVKSVQTHRIIPASELLNEKQDAFYICEAGTDGYAIISADERMTPVLGFSQSRSFDPENIPDGLQDLLNSYNKEYEALVSGMPMRLTRRKIEGVKEQVGPLFITQWGQGAPYNNLCPMWEGERCITGCVAISTAQTLYYYQYPDSAIGKVDYTTRTNKIHIKEDLSDFKFNWPLIRGTYKYGASEKECDAVANLAYACAVAVQMNFGLTESSSGAQYQVKAMVKNFGYDPDMASIHKDYMSTNEWQTQMLNELNNERPIIYAANSSGGGHSFIIDGYKADEDGYPFYHVNWGWEGLCDDYYKLSSLEGGNNVYTLNHEAIIYVQPDNKKQDCGFFWQAQDIDLSSARINPNVTHSFTVTLNNIFNYSYKTFSGKIEVYLRNEKEEEILVGSSNRINNAVYGSGWSKLNIQATLPNNIKEDNYTLVIRSKADGYDKMDIVTYPSPLTLTVTTITESYTPNIMITRLENVGKDLEDLSVSIQAFEPMNFAATPFTGSLRMAVTDDEGNILTLLGDVANIKNLGQYGQLAYYYTLTGKIPDYLEDGKYHLFLAANQSGYLEWGKVTGYEVMNGTILSYGKDLNIPFWLEDGKIIYHKAGEEELPESNANIQATDMQVTSFSSKTRHIEMQMSNIFNFSSEIFTGQFSMVVYNESDKFIAAFGDVQKWTTQPIVPGNGFLVTIPFSGNLPEELKDGYYTVKIAAKQNGCRGWNPIKGWSYMEVQGGLYLLSRDVDLGFDFEIWNGRMFKVDTDGLMAPLDNTEQSPIYNLSGIQTQNYNKKGIYIVGGKKVMR